MEIQKRNDEFFKHQSEFFPYTNEIYDVDSLVTDASFSHSGHLKKIIRVHAFIVSTIILIISVMPDRIIEHILEDEYISGFYTDLKGESGDLYDIDFTEDFSEYDTSYHIEREIYVVQSGDTLWDIAERYMGNGMGYHVIAEENHLTNPDLIFPDNVLVVPVVFIEN